MQPAPEQGRGGAVEAVQGQAFAHRTQLQRWKVIGQMCIRKCLVRFSTYAVVRRINFRRSSLLCVLISFKVVGVCRFVLLLLFVCVFCFFSAWPVYCTSLRFLICCRAFPVCSCCGCCLCCFVYLLPLLLVVVDLLWSLLMVRLFLWLVVAVTVVVLACVRVIPV